MLSKTTLEPKVEVNDPDFTMNVYGSAILMYTFTTTKKGYVHVITNNTTFNSSYPTEYRLLYDNDTKVAFDVTPTGTWGFADMKSTAIIEAGTQMKLYGYQQNNSATIKGMFVETIPSNLAEKTVVNWGSTSSNNYTTQGSGTFTNAGVVRFVCNWKTNYANYPMYIRITVNWVAQEKTIATTNYSDVVFDFWYTTGSWSVEYRGTWQTVYLDRATAYLYSPLEFTKKYTNLLPRALASLWDTAYCTLCGNHIDNKYYGGLMMGKSGSVTTGAIVLGNAVGFIKVNFNGEIIKIPYYAE